MRVGLVGFGLAGRSFHAPLIEATDGLALSAVVTSRRDEVAAAYPGTEALARVTASGAAGGWAGGRAPTPSPWASRARADGPGSPGGGEPHRFPGGLGGGGRRAGAPGGGGQAARGERRGRGGARPRRRAPGCAADGLPQPPLGRRLPHGAAAAPRARARRGDPLRVAL